MIAGATDTSNSEDEIVYGPIQCFLGIQCVQHAHADSVFVLAVNNQEHKDQQIFVNEDLTSRRSKLANETRQMKSSKKITDCWTYNGKVLVKDLSKLN